jgi:RNA 3'-terminal phosphate cyclase (ATP)
MSTTPLELDGSEGEGGGQILRSSLTLSLLTGQAFHLRHVRARRPKPGLQPQHLMAVRAAAAIGKAELRGASLGSTDLVFTPGPVLAGNYRFDIGTAGATGLVLQTLYLPLALRGEQPSHLSLVGGTHVLASPCFHFLQTTWLPYLQKMGLRVSLRMDHPGFYPRGGGRVEVDIQPCGELRGFRLGQPGSGAVRGFSAVAGLPEDIARRQARRARHRLEKANLRPEIALETWSGGPGSVLAVIVETAAVPALFFGLGARGKPAEKVADEAVDQVIAYVKNSPTTVDPHSADQIVLPLALAEGPSSYPVSEVTRHLLTNVAVIRRFLARDIDVAGAEGEPGEVRIT